MSYKFTKEQLEELLVDYNRISFEKFGFTIPESVDIWDETLRDGEQCYKAIYGIQSHQCIQMTPVPPDLCSHQCLYCWRVEPRDLGIVPQDPTPE